MLGQTGHLDQCVVYVLCSCGAVVPIKDTEEAKGVILPSLLCLHRQNLIVHRASGKPSILRLSMPNASFALGNAQFKS